LRFSALPFPVSRSLFLLAFGGLTLLVGPAKADRIRHPLAVFSGLDKITGRIISFEVATDETVQFGTLQITERACYTRPSTETPQTITFVEIDEIDADDKKKPPKRVFTGWMFASSPGLHALEHPVYDIWLNDCKGGKEVLPTPNEAAGVPPTPENARESTPAEVPAKPVKPRVKPKPVEQPREDNGGDAGENWAPPPPIERMDPESMSGAPVEVGPPPGMIPDAAPPAPRKQRRRAPPPPVEPPADGLF